MKPIVRLFAIALVSTLAAQAFAGQVEVRLKDGSRWRGETTDRVDVAFTLQGVTVNMQGKLEKVEDLYIVVDGAFAGQTAKKTIFKSDIVTMKTLESAGDTDTTAEVKTNAESGSGAAGANTAEVNEKQAGVFVLPMSGMVGEGFRHEEIEKVAKHADKFGPGQIIVLEMDSGGGTVEMEKIHYTIAEVRKRHRVVAWIKSAISAAAASASNCHEIYFYSHGTLGAMTGFAGDKSLQGDQLRQWMMVAGNWMEFGGRSKYIAWAMIDDVALLSYDKDPVTGEVTWHNDLSGEFVLSDAKTNLVFTSSTAAHSGFSDGTADTGEELAKLLNLPRWHEKDDYGRRIHKEWTDTVEQAKEELPLLFRRYQYKGTGGSAKEAIGAKIQIIKDIIRWWDRAHNVCELAGVPPKDRLERELEELKRTMSKMD